MRLRMPTSSHNLDTTAFAGSMGLYSRLEDASCTDSLDAMSLLHRHRRNSVVGRSRENQVIGQQSEKPIPSFVGLSTIDGQAS
jgi:hypothetical protein